MNLNYIFSYSSKSNFEPNLLKPDSSSKYPLCNTISIHVTSLKQILLLSQQDDLPRVTSLRTAISATAALKHNIFYLFFEDNLNKPFHCEIS